MSLPRFHKRGVVPFESVLIGKLTEIPSGENDPKIFEIPMDTKHVAMEVHTEAGHYDSIELPIKTMTCGTAFLRHVTVGSEDLNPFLVDRNVKEGNFVVDVLALREPLSA